MSLNNNGKFTPPRNISKPHGAFVCRLIDINAKFLYETKSK